MVNDSIMGKTYSTTIIEQEFLASVTFRTLVSLQSSLLLMFCLQLFFIFFLSISELVRVSYLLMCNLMSVLAILSSQSSSFIHTILQADWFQFRLSPNVSIR